MLSQPARQTLVEIYNFSAFCCKKLEKVRNLQQKTGFFEFANSDLVQTPERWSTVLFSTICVISPIMIVHSSALQLVIVSHEYTQTIWCIFCLPSLPGFELVTLTTIRTKIRNTEALDRSAMDPHIESHKVPVIHQFGCASIMA